MTFSRRQNRESEPASAVKSGSSRQPEGRSGQKRPADETAATSQRPAQRPRLVPANGLPTPKVCPVEFPKECRTTC